MLMFTSHTLLGIDFQNVFFFASEFQWKKLLRIKIHLDDSCDKIRSLPGYLNYFFFFSYNKSQNENQNKQKYVKILSTIELSTNNWERTGID